MMTFLLPAICMIVIFWISVGIVYLMLRSQLAPIIRSIRRLERQNSGRNTEDYTADVVRIPTPRPVNSRYITVDRTPKY